MSNNYTGLRRLKRSNAASGRRCAERLLAMRKSLAPLRARKSDASLLLATWNIRDFDSNKFRFGPRLPETFYYIAEIMSCFDLVAVQEVNRDLSALEKVNKKIGYLQILILPRLAFFQQYILKGNIFDGIAGLMVSEFHMITKLFNYMKMWELQNKNNTGLK